MTDAGLRNKPGRVYPRRAWSATAALLARVRSGRLDTLGMAGRATPEDVRG
ncbi:MAG: hypothetical protein QJR02_04910 [Sinobacteraceae bacterium]|nr:hypothetical protein [Nevskiaceae bacterium]